MSRPQWPDSPNSLSHDPGTIQTSETTPQGTVSYSYDHADRRATMTVTGQPMVTYSYDNANRLTSVTRGTSTTTISYDDANRRTGLTLPTDLHVTYDYDAASQLVALTYTQGQTTIGTLTYVYDAAGRRIQMGGTHARVALPEAVLSATYDAANRLLQWGDSTLTYDANGNMTTDGLTSFTWDARNRLTALGGAASASFQYDAVGRRIGKVVGGQATQFLYDGSDVVHEMLNGVVTASMLRGATTDELWSRTDAQGDHIVLTDGLGSTIAQLDSSGTTETSYDYEPFGASRSMGSTSGNTFQFTGRENDGAVAGLMFYRARYYSAATGRFISEDPIEFEGGTNLYTYVHNDPIDFTDPGGTCECSIDAKCRPVHDWRARVVGAVHCYFVVKGKDQQQVTLTGGPQNGILRAWEVPWVNGRDPSDGNSPFDQTVYRSVGSQQVCKDGDCLKEKREQFYALGLSYRSMHGPNSNTFVSWSARQCGLSVVLPVGAIGRGPEVP